MYSKPIYRVTVRKEDDEWVAVLYKNGVRQEEGCYYASDKQDALDTAKAMRLRLAR